MEAEMHAFVDSLRKNITAEDVVNLEACMDCKMCGEACAWYLVTGDEKLHPTHKTGLIRQVYQRYMTIEGQIGGALGLIPTPDGRRPEGEHALFSGHARRAGAARSPAPAGISTRRIVRLARAAYTDSGLSNANPTIKSIIDNTERYRHSFGLTIPQVIGRVGLFLRSEGIEVPVDVHGAELLFVCPAAATPKSPITASKWSKSSMLRGSVTPSRHGSSTPVPRSTTLLFTTISRSRCWKSGKRKRIGSASRKSCWSNAAATRAHSTPSVGSARTPLPLPDCERRYPHARPDPGRTSAG